MNKYVIIISALLIGIITSFLYITLDSKPTVVNAWAKKQDNIMVFADKVWEIDFSKKMNVNTIKKNTVFVTDENGKVLDLLIKVSEDKQGVSIYPPNGGYDPNTSYVLHVKRGIKSIDGQSLRSGKSISFTVTKELPVVGSKDKLHSIFMTALEKYKEGFDGRGFALFKEEKTESSAVEKSTSDSSSDFSETNVQVQGVDEADLVKTDGTFIYRVIDRKLTITSAVPAGNIENVSTVKYNNFEPFQLFLDGDSLVVIGHTYNHSWKENGKESEKIMPIHSETKALIYDIKDRSHPEEVRSITIEGSFVTSRKIGPTVYLINQHYPDIWRLEKEGDLDLRPRFSDSAKSDKIHPIAYEDIRYFPDSNETNYSIIATFNIEKPEQEASFSTYLGSGRDIYMSKENLYMAVGKYRGHPMAEEVSLRSSEETEIYRFEVTDNGVKFAAAGTVPGRILNQFSMDEYEGHFRIATTRGNTWNEQDPSGNNLYILDEKLKTVGSVEDLARGEKIYSVRFMGEKAYVVTFKEVDPLFVLDVSDPKKPLVLGELKIPGFSNYLHPYDENHLIGFGQHTKLVTDKNGKSPRVLTDGVKISIFDVTDPLHPKEKFTEIIGGRGTYSPLNHDHKALLFNKNKGIFAFPITVYENKEGSEYEQILQFQGAFVYNVDMQNGFQLKHKLTHTKQNSSSSYHYENWEDQILRVLYIKDYVYGVSPTKISAVKY